VRRVRPWRAAWQDSAPRTRNREEDFALAPRLRRLRRGELPIDTTELARALIGRVIVRDLGGERLAGRIVETEAYPVGDLAAHHVRGPTPRNRSMFLAPGHAYVYFCYGCWFMLNVSARSRAWAAACWCARSSRSRASRP